MSAFEVLRLVAYGLVGSAVWFAWVRHWLYECEEAPRVAVFFVVAVAFWPMVVLYKGLELLGEAVR